MPNRNSPALIINDGGLAGLIACWAEGMVRATLAGAEKRPAPIAWFPSDNHSALEKRRHAVRNQTELCGLSECSDRQLLRIDALPHDAKIADSLLAGAHATTMLLNACLEAASRGLSRVIWPVHVGQTPEQHLEVLGAIGDRALLVSELMLIDTPAATRGGKPIKIETPYIDFSDAQIIDLALDMDAPLGACWWCLNEQDDPCNQCSQCLRWREALLAVDPARALTIENLRQQQTPAPV